MEKCVRCDKKFKKKDEVVITDAFGIKEMVHTDCLYDYVLGASKQDYYDTYEDYLLENK
ncbi:hypothetical protein QT711_03445 [Sporosarcina saromensis]|uniref:Uncharacterized protein n=1 Tax=Sporosarcina saromensis TaxID=359365 RepID=A0ABU4G7D0_9BACL|nr:hypothetical protein [Sporosarcina saromensis]MDW0112225.1 hypothetical protein [Sporosarcina saromensis]